MSSLYGVPVDFATGMALADEEEVKQWRIGRQLVYRLLVEAHYPNHKDGIAKFLDIVHNLQTYIMHDTQSNEAAAHSSHEDDVEDDETENSIQTKDVIKMFDVIVKENKPKLLAHILDNAAFPGAQHSGSIAKKALKQAIRVGSLEILEFLIERNVQIISASTSDGKYAYDEIRSLLFNILQSVRIGYKSQHSNNLLIANKFWRYLSDAVYNLYHVQTENADEDRKNEQAEQEENDDGLLVYDQTNETSVDDVALTRHLKFMMSNALIICSIYKYIHSSLSGKNYVEKLKPILFFVCEHYMSLDDECDLDALYKQCENDRLFDCSSLKPFNIKYNHALQQEYNKTKYRRNVHLFWSEYILIKLINDYLGIDVSKMNTAKRIDQYGRLNVSDADMEEREEMLYCVRYIVSNGAAQHLEDVLLPLLNEYQKRFVKTDDDKREMDKLFAAVEYGGNIWKLRQMSKEDTGALFANVCNNSVQLPLQLCSLIVSFVVLSR